MRLELLNAVILAEDYAALRDWYRAALGLDLKQEWSESYHYAELSRDGKLVVGIADAKEMGLDPIAPRRNAIVAQFRVSDVPALCERVKEHEGTVLFGPSYEEKEGFSYCAFTDPEGNQLWAVDGL
jgi:predicted enzyme related to lactoylglutathione lyase